MKRYLFLLLLLSLGGCQPGVIFREYQTLPDEKWCVAHKNRFEVEIPESGEYNIRIGIRHTTDYEMANLWCFISMSDSNQIVKKDTVNIRLAEPDGRWLGDGNTLKTVETTLPGSARKMPAGKYTFTLEQGMRVKCLPGVKNVGLIITRTDIQQ